MGGQEWTSCRVSVRDHISLRAESNSTDLLSDLTCSVIWNSYSRAHANEASSANKIITVITGQDH